MKFEHVLQIYWTKGFFFGGTLFYTNQTIPSLMLNTPGLANKTKKLLNQRFELNLLMSDTKKLLPTYENETSKIIIKPLNVFLSQINTVNNQYTDLLRLIIMRMYLVKSYRGRCHAIGKPVKGQRT
jgi:ribosomal protein S13